jgi:hypothetical protein
MFCDPRAELALAIHAKTDNGNKIVDFLKDVLDQNIPDVRLTHRLQSARMLTKHGHFPDAEQFIQRHANKPGPKKTRRDVKETSEFDAALAEVIRAEISPASTAQWLIDVMQGRTPAIETGIDTFKPHHRMRAVREILARAYDRDYSYARTTQADLRVPTQTEADAMPEEHHDASDLQVGESDNPEHPIHPVNPDSDEEAEPIDYVAMAKEIVANLDPSEFEEEPESNHKPDYSMWDIIRKQPPPVITEEHQRIAMARLDEKLERRRLWKESSVKIPTRKDNSNYDDG